MARTVVSKSLRLVYEKDGKKRSLSVRRFNPDATDENIGTFKGAIQSVCDMTFDDVIVTTVEDVE